MESQPVSPMSPQMNIDIQKKYVLSMKNVLKENIGYQMDKRPKKEFIEECTSLFTKIFLENENGMLFVNYVYQRVSFELDNMMNKKNTNLNENELVHLVFKGGTNMFLLKNLIEQYIENNGGLGELTEEMDEFNQLKEYENMKNIFKVSDSDYTIYILTQNLERYCILNDIVKNNLSLILMNLKLDIESFFPPNMNVFSEPPSSPVTTPLVESQVPTSNRINYLILKKRNESQNVLYWIIKYNILFRVIKKKDIQNEMEKQSLKQLFNSIYECIIHPEANKYSPVIYGKIVLILNLIKNTTKFTQIFNKIYMNERVDELKRKAFTNDIDNTLQFFYLHALEDLQIKKDRLLGNSFITPEKIQRFKVELCNLFNKIKINEDKHERIQKERVKSEREGEGENEGMNKISKENPYLINETVKIENPDLERYLHNRQFFYDMNKQKKTVFAYKIGREVTINDIFIEPANDFLLLSSNQLNPLGYHTNNHKNDYHSYFSFNNNIHTEHPMVGFDTHFDLYRLKINILLKNRVVSENTVALDMQPNNLLFSTKQFNSLINLEDVEPSEIQYKPIKSIKLNSELVDISIPRYYDNVLVKLRKIFYNNEDGIEEYFNHFFMISCPQLDIQNMYIYNFQSVLDDLNFTLYEKIFYEQLFEKKFNKRIIRHIFMLYFTKIFSYYYGNEGKRQVEDEEVGIMKREHHSYFVGLKEYIEKIRENLDDAMNKRTIRNRMHNMNFESFFDIPDGFTIELLFSVQYLKTQYGKKPYTFYKVDPFYHEIEGFLNQITIYYILLLNYYQTNDNQNLKEFYSTYNEIYNMYNTDYIIINNNFINLLDIYIKNIRMIYRFVSFLIEKTDSNILKNGILYGGVKPAINTTRGLQKFYERMPSTPIRNK